RHVSHGAGPSMIGMRSAGWAMRDSLSLRGRLPGVLGTSHETVAQDLKSVRNLTDDDSSSADLRESNEAGSEVCQKPDRRAGTEPRRRQAICPWWTDGHSLVLSTSETSFC